MEGLIDLFEKYALDDVGKVQSRPALFDLLGKPPKSRRWRLSHSPKLAFGANPRVRVRNNRTAKNGT